MEAYAWLGENWLDVVQTFGIVTAFFFTLVTIRREGQARRLNTLLELGKQHGAIWKELAEYPELRRVLDDSAALHRAPVTPEERRFVISLILHLNGVHQAINSGMFIRLEGLQPDIRQFFSRPIPNAVWQSVKPFQNKDFVVFVENGDAVFQKRN
jgi:hypothetical protein